MTDHGDYPDVNCPHCREMAEAAGTTVTVYRRQHPELFGVTEDNSLTW
jgi:hypothetical protein